MSRNHNYYVYIMTNKSKKVLYVGVTNSLGRRVYEHERGMIKGFTKKYNCHYLVFYEHFTDIELAIKREKEIKKWRRAKKDALIQSTNPDFAFLNERVKYW
ncbi:MAG: GIY-YIG nuclease family protein [Bacteroidales bacterium]|nr:GIY-YIG nuclease family protein [Bacteroidales bacterium]MCF8388547.1 GIY-YIG nuclease family protein [Bacteroidales bacterium]MCF8397625.1 GIY-YIG nuclease family protein [Bacteroidales bacterium]